MSTISHPNSHLDAALLKRHFDAAAPSYNSASLLAREIGQRMASRLDYIRLSPHTIVDLGCGSGNDLSHLQQRYQQARLIGIDYSLPMLHQAQTRQPGWKSLFSRLFCRPFPRLLCANANALPLASHSISLLWSNLVLLWLEPLSSALKEAHRVLEAEGLFTFSTLGPDTLQELAVLPRHKGRRIHCFSDMHDIGDALMQAGFSDPVVDMEIIHLTYERIDELFADLKDSGCNNAAIDRPHTLCGKHAWAQARIQLESLRGQQRLPITFEVIQGHAWKKTATTTADGAHILQFQPSARRADA